jgi:hypothetical protein
MSEASRKHTVPGVDSARTRIGDRLETAYEPEIPVPEIGT